MADSDEDSGQEIDLSPLVEGLRRTGLSEAESWALVNDPEAWRAFGNGLAEAQGWLDQVRDGIPLPTHSGKGHA